MHRLHPAFGSHNIRSLAHAIAAAEARGFRRRAYELQTLFGMGDVIQRALVDRGHRVRVYTPYGAMLPGMAYLVRRLLENTSNESFLKASFTERARIDDLLRNPEEIGAMLTRTRRSEKPRSLRLPLSAELPPFRNEPPTDFARADQREAMQQALEDVRTELGKPLSALDRRRGGRYRASAAGFGEPEPQLTRRGPGSHGRGRACRTRPSPLPERLGRFGRQRRHAIALAS